jgi:drug/metabolite transporter (DMT)-like permease
MVERQKALLALMVTVVFWGLSFISIKIAVAVFPPMSLGALRFSMALVLLYLIKRKMAPHEKMDLRDLPYLLGAGLIGVTAYFFCENNGVSLISASEASIIIAAIPVITMIADQIGQYIKFRGKQNVTAKLARGPAIAKRRWFGAVLSVAGVWLVAGGTLQVSGNLRGYIFMGGAAVSWVVYSFLSRPLFNRHSRIFIVFWQTVFGFLGFLPFAFLELPNWGHPTAAVWFHVAYLGIFCSALGYWFYAMAMGSLGVSTSTVFINLIPVVTVVTAFFALQDRLQPIQWLGAAAVLSGVYAATLEGGAHHSREKAIPS